MSTKPVIKHQRLALMMMAITLIAGLMGFVFQLMPDGTMLTFLVGVSAIGGLAGSSQSFDERENQLLWKSYSKAFEYFFFILYMVYALVMFSTLVEYRHRVCTICEWPLDWPGGIHHVHGAWNCWCY